MIPFCSFWIGGGYPPYGTNATRGPTRLTFRHSCSVRFLSGKLCRFDVASTELQNCDAQHTRRRSGKRKKARDQIGSPIAATTVCSKGVFTCESCCLLH